MSPVGVNLAAAMNRLFESQLMKMKNLENSIATICALAVVHLAPVRTSSRATDHP
jgi:hypothetical protein